jgi:hypothetical protein
VRVYRGRSTSLGYVLGVPVESLDLPQRDW